MSAVLTESPGAIDTKNEVDALAELIDQLVGLRYAGKMTPCVGKIAAAVVLRFGRGDMSEWATYGASCAYSKSCTRLGIAFDEFIKTQAR